MYSFVSKLVTVPTAHYGDILLYQDFIVPGMLSDAYTKMKDGGECSAPGTRSFTYWTKTPSTQTSN